MPSITTSRALDFARDVAVRLGASPADADRTAELLVLLNPGDVEEVRDRGLVLAALECYALAAADLEAYVQAAPHSPEAPPLRARIAELRHRAARLN